MSDLFGGSKEDGAMQEDSRNVKAAIAGETKPAGAKAASPAQPTTGGMRFEDAFARLEGLVGEMEKGELQLEEMLVRFEEGVALVKHCNQFLKQAQLRVEQFVEQQDGHWVLKDLEG